jgi:hypothetical protein
MPLKKSDSDEATEKNFEEMRNSATYKRTRRKFGRKTANRQMVAAVLSNKRKATQRKRGSKR